MSTKRIVILGGGFAGAYTAMHLERLLGREDDAEIVLVNRENYFVFQPMLAEVVAGSVGVVETITPLRRLCPRTHLHTREVVEIDLAARTVTLSPGFRPRPLVLPYDHLVLALGNVTNFAGLPGVQEHALPFKTLGDALHLRNHVLHALEEAAIEPDPELRRELLTFVVAGGGFSGVEVAAELNDFVRKVARDYRGLDPAALRVVLLHSGERILPELSETLGRFAQRVLTRRGVELRLKARLAGATAASAILNTGETIPTRTLVSTVPSAPHPLLVALPLPTDRGRVVVDECLEVPGSPGVWAVGDCALIIDARSKTPAPPTGQHATREARCAARNIVATLRGRPKTPFSFPGLGKLGSLGHRSAVAEVLGVKLSGLLAWFLWRSIYLLKMPGLERKIRVATDWTLDLFLPGDIVQLKIDRTTGLMQEHFEPGQVIVRQGDLGDRLYIVTRGEVEVLQELAEREVRRLATLGPGAHFGEMALLSDAPRMATVRAVTPVDVLAVSRHDFLALFRSLPPLREIFEEMARQRLLAAQALPGAGEGGKGWRGGDGPSVAQGGESR
jgi:NADH dehydrogenase